MLGAVSGGGARPFCNFYSAGVTLARFSLSKRAILQKVEHDFEIHLEQSWHGGSNARNEKFHQAKARESHHFFTAVFKDRALFKDREQPGTCTCKIFYV